LHIGAPRNPANVVPERVPAETLRQFGQRLLTAGGLPVSISGEIVGHLIDNSLRGIDSHGIVRYGYYLEQIENGGFDPHGTISITRETANTTLLDGGGGHGIPAMRKAAEMTAAKALDVGVAAAAIRNCGHTGRVGAYAEAIARQDCFAMITGGGMHKTLANVAAHGSREGVMSTNPYAFALPGGPAGAVVVDFATSALAQGKLLFAKEAGTPLTPGLILDRDGNPSIDPGDFYDGGLILPAAGPKGSGMGLMAELIGYGLLGDALEFNWLIIAMSLSALAEEDYQTRIDSYIAWVNDRQPAVGFDTVLAPGQPEARILKKRMKHGIPVADGLRRTFSDWALRLGVADF
jgi:LDH2 family malate/lactate/ureidoglycolate dehydrogenase